MLPLECLVHIFEYLNGSDIINLRKTCTTFAHAVKYIKCPGSVVNYTSETDIIPYGFVNCKLVNYIKTDMLSKCNSVECLSTVEDICTYNGVNKFITNKHVNNSGMVNIPYIKAYSITLTDFTNNFRRLELLNITGTLCTETISNLPNLKYLCINSGTIGSIRDLPNLKYLDIKDVKVDTITNLPDLKILKCSNVISEEFENLEALRCKSLQISLPKLRKLHVSSGTIPHIPSLVELKARSFSRDNTYMFTHIRELDITNSNVTNVSMLTNLVVLKAANTPIIHIENLTKLEVLDISNTNVCMLPRRNRIHTLKADRYRYRTLENIQHVKRLSIFMSNIRKLPDDNIIEELFASYSKLEDISNLRYLVYAKINGTRIRESHNNYTRLL